MVQRAPTEMLGFFIATDSQESGVTVQGGNCLARKIKKYLDYIVYCFIFVPVKPTYI